MPSFLHRCDVFESGYHVRLRGTGPADLCPVDAALEPEIVNELETVVGTHDFGSRPIATGLLGSHHVWCLASLGGAFRVLMVERSKYPRRVDAIARRHHLARAESAHLRYAAGGTELAVVAARMGISVEAAEAERRFVLDRVGVTSAAELAEVVTRTSPEVDVRELGARMHAMLASAPLRTS